MTPEQKAEAAEARRIYRLMVDALFDLEGACEVRGLRILLINVRDCVLIVQNPGSELKQVVKIGWEPAEFAMHGIWVHSDPLKKEEPTLENIGPLTTGDDVDLVARRIANVVSEFKP